MEASMNDHTTPRTAILELAIPSILVQRDSRPCAPPIQVPELAPIVIADILARVDCEERVLGVSRFGQAPTDISSGSDLDVLRVERMGLESLLPELRSARDALRDELAGLRQEIRIVRLDRAELEELAELQAALEEAPLEQVDELPSDQIDQDQEELLALRREVQALRRRNSELDGPPVGFRFPTELLRIGFWVGKQRFDDS